MINSTESFLTALAKEREILTNRLFTPYLTKDRDVLITGGSTECFTHDVLGLLSE